MNLQDPLPLPRISMRLRCDGCTFDIPVMLGAREEEDAARLGEAAAAGATHVALTRFCPVCGEDRTFLFPLPSAAAPLSVAAVPSVSVFRYSLPLTIGEPARSAPADRAVDAFHKGRKLRDKGKLAAARKAFADAAELFYEARLPLERVDSLRELAAVWEKLEKPGKADAVRKLISRELP